MGNNASSPSEGAFESPSASSSFAEEQNSSRLSVRESNVSQEFSSNNSSLANEHHSKSESYCPNNSILFDRCDNSLSASLTDRNCILFDATEKIAVLGSPDSSNSSIINISTQSSESISEDNEQSKLSSEALLVECIDKIQALLSIVYQPGSAPNMCDKTLKSLSDLHQTISVFANNSDVFQHNSENEAYNNTSQMKADLPTLDKCYTSMQTTAVGQCDSSGTANANQHDSSCEESTGNNTTSDSSKYFTSMVGEQSSKFLDSSMYICLRCDRPLTHASMESTVDKEEHFAVASHTALETCDNSSADNLSLLVQTHNQEAYDKNTLLTSKDTADKCTFVAEKLSVEPLLMKSLTALQATTGVKILLTDAETSTGIIQPLYTASPQLIVPEASKQSKSSPKRELPNVGDNTSIPKLQEETTPQKRITQEETFQMDMKNTLSYVRYPIAIGLESILDCETSAATVGKAVIRNALAFEKYSTLFKRALNDDVVTAAIGKALCQNALCFDSLAASMNIGGQCQYQQAMNPTIDKVNAKKQDPRFTSNQQHGPRNKENENPSVERLFKQTASKRKLGTLEEDTRRTKCLGLSQKQAADTYTWNDDFRVKPGRKATISNLGNNDSAFKAGINVTGKAKRKVMLREIVLNGPTKEAEKEPLKLRIQTNEKWTIIGKNNEVMNELEASDDENAVYPHANSKLNNLKYKQTKTEVVACDKIVKTDYSLIEESIEGTSKQLDPWTGIYYFANKYIFCSICNTNIFSYLRVLNHINEHIHRTNLIKHSNVAASFVSVGAMLRSIWDQIEINLGRKLFCKLVQFEDDMLLCSLCDVQVCGCLNVIAHVLAKKHQENVLNIVYSSTPDQNFSKREHTEAAHHNLSWPDGTSQSPSDLSQSESEGSIVEWLPTRTPTRATTLEIDLSGIYYFAKNYVFCSTCNINMFNSSIVLGHVHAKSHQANVALQKQIESRQKQFSVLENETKVKQIWNQIERTLGGTLFHTVLCVNSEANFFCDLCNMQVIIPGHLNILDHVCGRKHNKEFLKQVQLPVNK